MRIAFGLALLAITGLAAPTLSAQTATEPKSLPVGTCINMGNSLEPEQEGSWGGSNINAADFERIAAAGFDTVRIPVRWHNKSQSQAPYTVDPEWMARVTQVVDQALAADLNVILNSHHFDPIHEDPAEVAAWHGGVWKQIADRFADYPEDRLWFELENEPHNEFDNDNLIATLAPAFAAVRASNPTRPVIYGGGNWSGIDSLATLPLPDDANVYPTFHYYEPFDFTHQGAEWAGPDVPPPGRRYGTAADRARLTTDVAKIEAYIERTGLVPFMGETGAYDKHISTAERAQYHRAVFDAFAPTGMGICTWAYANTFPFYDQSAGRWVPGMLESIGLGDQSNVADAPAAGEVPGDRGPEPTGRNLPPVLSALDGELPGWLINDPSSLDWAVYGDRVQVKPVQDETIPGGGAALRLTSRKAGDPWSAGVNVPLIADIEEGRPVVIGFWARSVGGLGELLVRFQQNREPYPGFGDTEVPLTEEWRFIEVSGIADRAIKQSDAIVTIQFGAAKQTVEIGQALVLVGSESILQ